MAAQKKRIGRLPLAWKEQRTTTRVFKDKRKKREKDKLRREVERERA